MGVTTYDKEVRCALPAAKLYQYFVLQGDTFIPDVVPRAIKSIEILEGDGGPGTIKLITFGEGSQFKSMKQRVDVVDKDNMTYSYTVIEGDALVDPLESISYHIKVVPTEGGSIFKNRSIYTCKGDATIPEEQIKSAKEKAAGLVDLNLACVCLLESKYTRSSIL